MSDTRDDKLTAMLTTAWGIPRPGWDARALAAMADIRPRRHPNLLTYIIVAALLLLLAAGVFAAVRCFFVEGTLMFLEHDFGKPATAPSEVTHFFSGDLQWRESHLYGLPESIDLSPEGHQVCFDRRDHWPPERSDVFTANRDGSDEVNLTAALGGVNCHPQWSPDASMVGFTHADPAEGQLPCQAGWHAWVISADGSHAWPILPASRGANWFLDWSPDGARVLLWERSAAHGDAPEGFNRGNITTDIRGQDVRTLPNVGGHPAWSPDGSKIVSSARVPGHLGGDPGSWMQLLLTAADGSGPEVLVEQFIADEDIHSHLLAHGDGIMSDLLEQGAGVTFASLRLPGFVLEWVGPTLPVWSPSGDKIAFLAAMPFDPRGPQYHQQVEVWVYDLTTDELTRITDDDIWQNALTWR